MIIAEWIIYFMIFCFCVLSLGVGSVLLIIATNAFLDKKSFNNK